MRRIRIHIGEIGVSSEPAVISTTLGSCVSVCLFDAGLGIGGMNHILLPGRADPGYLESASRYGVNAMELLINRLMKAGASRPRLAAKAFGGASILPAIGPRFSPGLRNIAFVRDFLTVESIPLLGWDLGGVQTRLVHFYTASGAVLVKKLTPGTLAAQVEREERDYEARILHELGLPSMDDLFPQPFAGTRTSRPEE